jgi:hypothetical protein
VITPAIGLPVISDPTATFNPDAPSDNGVRCVNLNIPQGTVLVELIIRDTPTLGEECSPGYWKQTQHFDSYPASINPLSTTFGSIFASAPAPYATKTFPQAIDSNGGGFNALARHAAAAYLNSLTMAYGLTPTEVVNMVNAAFAAGPNSQALKDALAVFEGFLEDENCPLN